MEIRSSTSLRNQYNEISDYCKETGEPVFLTKNGDGDLVVMSIDAYQKREEILKIKEKIFEARVGRLSGAQGLTPEQLDEALKELLAK